MAGRGAGSRPQSAHPGECLTAELNGGPGRDKKGIRQPRKSLHPEARRSLKHLASHLPGAGGEAGR